MEETLSLLNDPSVGHAIDQTVFWLWLVLPVLLAIGLGPLAWSVWVRYAHYKWQVSRKYVVLEVKIPQETFKSPAAMELVLNALIQTGGEGTPHERYWKGKSRPWASLELAVIDGDIHFYIWCFDGQKNFLTANIYAQYPDVTVHEVEDYTKKVSQNLDKYDVWACQYAFGKPDPYPIKTYVDYGLSDDPDEEFKVDPLGSLLEVLGTTHKDDQIWFQFVTRAHKAESTIFNNSTKDQWIEEAKEEIQKIIDSASVEDAEGFLRPSQAKMTTEKKDLIDAISRSIAKYPLDVGVRCIQAYPKGESSRIRRDLIKGAFRQFGSTNLNNIKPDDQDYNYYWQDPAYYFNIPFMTPRNHRIGQHVFKCYCLRSYFFYPYQAGAHIPFLPWAVKSHPKKIMVMNTEELATLYHFPGSTVKAPALRRIPSKRADAPPNLPI
ncbi:MAG: hypothetical protein WC767_00815 [Candidatus Paceibacterota bacterium]|jgi:hypothetical protein